MKRAACAAVAVTAAFSIGACTIEFKPIGKPKAARHRHIATKSPKAAQPSPTPHPEIDLSGAAHALRRYTH